MLYLYTRVLMTMSIVAVGILPVIAAPFDLTPRRADSLPQGDDSPRPTDGLIFHRSGDFELGSRKMPGQGHGESSQQSNGGRLTGIPFKAEDLLELRATTTANATGSLPTQGTRPQPSSGITILPRMFSLDVKSEKSSKRHLTPTAKGKNTTSHTSAVPAATPSLSHGLPSGPGSGIAVE